MQETELLKSLKLYNNNIFCNIHEQYKIKSTCFIDNCPY